MTTNTKLAPFQLQTPGATVFPTAIGHCGLTWTEHAIRSVHLPEDSPAAMRKILAEAGGTPVTAIDRVPQTIQDFAARIAGVTTGIDDDLCDIPLDETSLSDFASSIYTALRRVSPGDTITYGDLAHRAGHHSSNMPRAVGQVLGRNPFGIVVPCHRVVAANGRLGGFSAHGGTATKIRLLRAEARGAGAPDMPWDLKRAHRKLRAVDPDMTRMLQLVGHRRPTLRAASSTVAALVESIIAQQVSTAAASSIHARLCAQMARPLDGPTAYEICSAPDEQLRSAGLSASKVASLRDLAQRAIVGEVPDLDVLATMGDEEIIDALTPIRGIGRWTVEMLLIFRLGRPDILPVDDLAVRKGYGVLTGHELSARELAQRGEIWAPWRSVVSWYLWRMSELA